MLSEECKECNRQDYLAYATAFKGMFSHVTSQFPGFKNGEKLDVILVDFDDAEAKGLKESMGNEQAERVLRGCHVHWTRSLQRVAKLVTNTKEEERLFLHLGRQIPQVADKEKVKKLFRILSGQESILEASELVDASLKLMCYYQLLNLKDGRNSGAGQSGGAGVITYKCSLERIQI